VRRLIAAVTRPVCASLHDQTPCQGDASRSSRLNLRISMLLKACVFSRCVRWPAAALHPPFDIKGSFLDYEKISEVWSCRRRRAGCHSGFCTANTSIHSQSFPSVPTISGRHGIGRMGCACPIHPIHSRVVFLRNASNREWMKQALLLIFNHLELVIRSQVVGNG
jgi:hypothetical protein